MRLLDIVDKQRYRTNDRKSHSLGIINKTYIAPDGSRLERPMSQTYIDHIKSRTSESIKRMKPNMGAYGA